MTAGLRSSWNWAPVFDRNRAAPGIDRTHVFQIGWVYELPFGKGKGMLNSGPASYILGGWQVNGVMACYTGVPFTVTAPGAALNAPNNTQTADQVKPGRGTSGPNRIRWTPTTTSRPSRLLRIPAASEPRGETFCEIPVCGTRT